MAPCADGSSCFCFSKPVQAHQYNLQPTAHWRRQDGNPKIICINITTHNFFFTNKTKNAKKNLTMANLIILYFLRLLNKMIFGLTSLRHKAVADVSNHNELIGRRCGIQLGWKSSCFTFNCFWFQLLWVSGQLICWVVEWPTLIIAVLIN